MLKLFRIFQGCFTVQLSRFFAVVLISSNFYIISLLLKFVNNFFIYFSIFRLKLCVSHCLCQTASLYYHPFQHLSTAFFIFLQKRAGGLTRYAKPEYTTPSKRNRYSCLRVSFYIFVKFCPVSHQRS